MRSAAIWWIAAIAVVIVIIIFVLNRPGDDGPISSQPSPHAIDQSN